MRPSILAASILAATLFAATGCIGAADDDLDTIDTSDTSESIQEATSELVATSGVKVSATYRYVVTGTPTYGYDATEPVLTVKVEVTDAQIRQAFPAFDGMESAFALIPKPQAGGAVAWETIPLAFKGTSLQGYYGQTKVDLHESAPTFGVNVAALEQYGVAVGLTTNVGTIWAQNPGSNWSVTKQ